MTTKVFWSQLKYRNLENRVRLSLALILEPRLGASLENCMSIRWWSCRNFRRCLWCSHPYFNELVPDSASQFLVDVKRQSFSSNSYLAQSLWARIEGRIMQFKAILHHSVILNICRIGSFEGGGLNYPRNRWRPPFLCCIKAEGCSSMWRFVAYLNRDGWKMLGANFHPIICAN